MPIVMSVGPWGHIPTRTHRCRTGSGRAGCCTICGNEYCSI